MGGRREQPWRQTGTASVVVLRAVVQYARARGVDVDGLLRGIGVPLGALDDFDRRIPEASRARVWIEASRQAGDPFFGLHVAQQAQLGVFDVLDYSLYFSSTLDEALDHLFRFHRVLSDAWAFRRTVEGGLVHVRRVVKTPPQEVEAAFTFLIFRARALTGRELSLREVTFTHPAPPDAGPLVAFFRCPVRFGAAACEVTFAARDLALPIHTGNPGVLKILDRYMTEMLGRLPASASFSDRVRAVVAQTLRSNGRPGLATSARELHASARTVQRRLAAEGTSHLEIVDAVRHELAERLVAGGRLSVTEIAYLTGFHDVSGFRRMYKRWTGTVPSQGVRNRRKIL